MRKACCSSGSRHIRGDDYYFRISSDGLKERNYAAQRGKHQSANEKPVSREIYLKMKTFVRCTELVHKMQVFAPLKRRKSIPTNGTRAITSSTKSAFVDKPSFVNVARRMSFPQQLTLSINAACRGDAATNRMSCLLSSLITMHETISSLRPNRLEFIAARAAARFSNWNLLHRGISRTEFLAPGRPAAAGLPGPNLASLGPHQCHGQLPGTDHSYFPIRK